MPHISRLTHPPKHHLFGFHDLVAWNHADSRMLAMEVDSIDHPPVPGQAAGYGYVSESGDYVRLGETVAFNFPQGSRMQWIGESECFSVNDRVGDSWGARVIDSETGEEVAELRSPVHCLDATSRCAFFPNYSRLYRLGGYGYPGIKDPTASEAIPSGDGVFRLDMNSGVAELLVSIRDVALCDAVGRPDRGVHHYVTHLLLAPGARRLAFLHRYRLRDGGEMTRLMTVGTNGSELRCLLQGSLSHFEWMGEDALIIWGMASRAVSALRSSPLLRVPLIRAGARAAKGVVRRLLASAPGVRQSFLRVGDTKNAAATPFALNILTGDGHPMRCPTQPNWFSVDTYPDEAGNRRLMLYRTDEQRSIELGIFHQDRPIPDYDTAEAAFSWVDPEILRQFTRARFAFDRSGYHCDLHPRWNARGTRVGFDSIHEGTRQIYMADVSDVMPGRANPSEEGR